MPDIKRQSNSPVAGSSSLWPPEKIISGAATLLQLRHFSHNVWKLICRNHPLENQCPIQTPPFQPHITQPFALILNPMISEARKRASRENGRKSRGPVTEMGKRISSRNATRHGLLAETLIIEGECRERFEQLLNSLMAEFRPETECELAEVEAMAGARWRLLRIIGMETANLSYRVRRQAVENPELAAEAPYSALRLPSRISATTPAFLIL